MMLIFSHKEQTIMLKYLKRYITLTCSTAKATQDCLRIILLTLLCYADCTFHLVSSVCNKCSKVWSYKVHFKLPTESGAQCLTLNETKLGVLNVQKQIHLHKGQWFSSCWYERLLYVPMSIKWQSFWVGNQLIISWSLKSNCYRSSHFKSKLQLSTHM